MDKYQTINIKHGKTRLILGVVFCILLVIVEIYQLYDPKVTTKGYVFAIAGLIVGTIGALILLYSLLFRQNILILIINEQGFILRHKYFVWWEQVKDIQLLNVNMPYGGIQRFIEVKLENLKTIPITYEKYNFQVLSYTQHSKKKSKYITMTLAIGNSNHKTQKVIEIMQQYKSEYDRIHQAENE